VIPEEILQTQSQPQLDWPPEELFRAFAKADAVPSGDEPPPGLAQAAQSEIGQQIGKAQVRGGKDPLQQATVQIDPVEVARKVQHRTQDELELALNAARVERHAVQNPEGVAGVDRQLARFKDLSDTDKIAGQAGPRARELWAKFTEAPTSLTDEEEIELFQSVRNVAETETRAVEGEVFRVDINDDGVIAHHEMPKGVKARNATRLPEAAVAASPGRKRYLTSLPTGEVVYGAEIDEETAAELNHLYPALVGKDGVPLWLDSRPSFVQDVETIRRRVDTEDHAHGESYLNTDIQKNGWHGFRTDDVIVVELERGQKIRLPRNVPPAVEIGVAEVDRWDEELGERVRQPVRKVLIQPGPDYEGKLGDLADELEIRGGSQPVIYGQGGGFAGFRRAREHVWTDGVQTYAARFGAEGDDLATPNAAYVYVRDDGELPRVRPPVGDEHKDFGDGLVLLNGAVLVDAPPNASLAANPFNFRLENETPPVIGVTVSNPPMLTPLWDEGQAQQYDAVARRVGREVQVASNSDDLAPAVEAAHVLRAAAIPASPLVVRSKTAGRLALPNQN